MSKIEEVVNSKERKLHFIETTVLGGIICPMIRLKKYDAFLYAGYRMEVEPLLSFFCDNDIEIKGIIYSDTFTRGEYNVPNIPYIHISEFNNKYYNVQNAFVIIAAKQFYTVEQTSILNHLFHAGVDKIYAIQELERSLLFGIHWSHIDYFKTHIDELNVTYEMLSDGKSRDVMAEYIRAIVEYDTYRLEQGHGKNKYFFAGTSTTEHEDIYKHLEDEVWVNCGASVGDTIFLYFDRGLNAKKIYAYEGDKKKYQSLCSSLEYLPEELRNKIQPIHEYISEGTPFLDYITEKITLVNADIEGNELEMLHAIEAIIKRDRPVLAICVYHVKNDLTDIPQYINTIVSDYKYILRKYAACDREPTRTAELVLYAVPDERYILNT